MFGSRGQPQPVTAAAVVAVQLGIFIGTAKLGQHSGMLLSAKVGLTLLGESPGEEGAAGAGRRGAGGQQGQQQRGGGKAAPPWQSQACKQAGHHSSSTSICSGWVTSIIGPL